MRVAVAMLLIALFAAGAFALAALSEPPAPADGAAATVELELTYDDDRGTRRRATLSCRGSTRRATGYLRRRSARRLCGVARELRGFLTSPPPQDRVCTEQWGGPDRAHVTGRIGGDGVDRRLARNDGCAIDDWDRAQRLLPKPRGAQAP